jgi:hypothetical protein
MTLSVKRDLWGHLLTNYAICSFLQSEFIRHHENIKQIYVLLLHISALKFLSFLIRKEEEEEEKKKKKNGM